MFNKILIANRGEIACRVIKTARRMGIATVAVYSDADRDALHVAMADEAVCIGPAPANESYLIPEKILAVAARTGAQAIHPGYGFLSENAAFCRACDEQGIVFIGPPVGAIEAMGSKSAAKAIMSEAAVPLLPGYHGDDQNPELLKTSARDIGYPVLLKASAGGGGKGMRIVWSADDFDSALAATRREALNAFGDDKILVEKFLTGPRHVEIQVFCDGHGNGVHLFERDCSLQRRHQKVIEEAPAPGMTVDLRNAMGSAAIQAAQAIGYVGAGTVEFLLGDNEEFYFMEMNTRLQVEHPVTEMISGQDLVEWQLRVAYGETLPCNQDELQINGHAFEARIYAEDPDNQFLPQTGQLKYLRFPAASDHVRIDSGVRQGDAISMYYDPMIAKLIVWGEDRASALRQLCKALEDTAIAGLATNTHYLRELAGHPEFAAANFDTGFIDKHYTEMHDSKMARREARFAESKALAALLLLLNEQSQQPEGPWAVHNWRSALPARRQLDLTIGGERQSLEVETLSAGNWQLNDGEQLFSVSGTLDNDRLKATVNGYQQYYTWCADGDSYCLFLPEGPLSFSRYAYSMEAAEQHGGLLAPMNGRVVSLLVSPGQAVKKGEVLMIMEAMKMEHSVTAPADGTVDSFHYAEGDLVEGGASLLDFSDASGE